LGLQLWSVRDALGADPDRTLEQIAAAGFEGVEPFGIGNPELTGDQRRERATVLGRELKRLGLAVPSTHVRMPRAPGLAALAEELAALGAAVAIISCPQELEGFGQDALATPDGVAEFAEELNALAAQASQLGLRIGYHNHWWDWSGAAEGAGYPRLVELVSPEIVFEIDAYWAWAAGQDPAALIRSLGRRAVFMHVKDGDGVPEQAQTALGEGSLEQAPVLEAGADFEWWFVELDEAEPGADPVDVVTVSLRWLREHTPGRTLP
jgi:sugar phosphate isomerase/epimerase